MQRRIILTVEPKPSHRRGSFLVSNTGLQPSALVLWKDLVSLQHCG